MIPEYELWLDPQWWLSPFGMLRAATLALIVIATIVLFARGLTRFVKLSAPLVVAMHFVYVGFTQGWTSVVVFVAILLTSITIVTVIGAMLWRTPYRKKQEPATAADCPEHAVKAIDQWAAEFGGEGFTAVGDFRAKVMVYGSQRWEFSRLMVDDEGTRIVQLCGVPTAKAKARQILSVLDNGKIVVTCDRMTDQETSGDPSIIANRVPERTTSKAMLARHATAVDKAPAAVVPFGDAVSAVEQMGAGWVDRMIEARQMRKLKDGWVGVNPMVVPVWMVRTWAGLFR